MIQVTKPRAWWRAAYTACLSEAARAVGAMDEVDQAHVFQLLPTLAEAADCPELEALESEIRTEVGAIVTLQERRAAKRAVRWVGGLPEGGCIGTG